MRVKISKRAEVTGGLPAIAINAYQTGTLQPENYSLPLDYTIEGELVGTIKVGAPVYVLRDIRNGVPYPGEFITTTVTEVTDTTFRTKNSVYEYSFLTPENN